ncbi:hypothetical protein BY458DRAFT_480786 [Sporodiniella umbellata]|nr:hypothetical protein BY458DRAFT_480786 [Sporodiniella umbellata]
MTLQLPNFPLFSNIVNYATKGNIAIDDARLNARFSYAQVLSGVSGIVSLLKKNNIKGERIAILCPSGYPYVIALLSVWVLGGIAVPICTTHPLPEQVYSVQESQASLILSHALFESRVKEIVEETRLNVIQVVESPVDSVQTQLVPADQEAGALIIFTSGTTGRPKGALLTHRTIDAQVSSLTQAWLWSSQDRIHHLLPLHHIHGIVNALVCPLYSGATLEMHSHFNAQQVWTRWNDKELPRVTVFMSVPTVYAKLSELYKKQEEEIKEEWTLACKQFRLMVSGSASLPTTLRNTWRKLSGGQVLLERYGMTEIGMALSQEYFIWERVEGTVGIPLPGVQVRIMTDQDVTETRNTPGMLQIKGPTVFKEYWQRPEATQKEFTTDGWFITGDIVQRVMQAGYYQILGRNSIDIIKTGGEKVSALEIEREILSCDLGIQDVAVVGIPDPEWGQMVSAVVVMEEGKYQSIKLEDIRDQLRKRLAVYKLPKSIVCLPELPKNAMGKVTKKDLVGLFQ